MLINKNAIPYSVKFISFDYKGVGLCNGVLTLEIDGQYVRFGHNELHYDWNTHSYLDEDSNNPNYDAFWQPDAQECLYDHCSTWEIDVEKIPEQYRKYAYDIDKIFTYEIDQPHCSFCYSM